jgi:SAM-dependent methyltransferase
MINYINDTYVDEAFEKQYKSYMEEIQRIYPIESNNDIFLNYRSWEYYQLMKYGDFEDTDIVLDTGALQTYFSVYLSQYVNNIIAMDNFYWYSRHYNATEKYQNPAQWGNYLRDVGSNISCQCADIEKLPYHDDLFDKILSISTIEHVLDDKKGMQEMYRVLRPGGVLLLTTEFNHDYPKDYDEADGSFYRVYNAAQIEELISCTEFTIDSPAITEKDNLPSGEFSNMFMRLLK